MGVGAVIHRRRLSGQMACQPERRCDETLLTNHTIAKKVRAAENRLGVQKGNAVTEISVLNVVRICRKILRAFRFHHFCVWHDESKNDFLIAMSIIIYFLICELALCWLISSCWLIHTSSFGYISNLNQSNPKMTRTRHNALLKSLNFCNNNKSGTKQSELVLRDGSDYSRLSFDNSFSIENRQPNDFMRSLRHPLNRHCLPLGMLPRTILENALIFFSSSVSSMALLMRFELNADVNKWKLGKFLEELGRNRSK